MSSVSSALQQGEEPRSHRLHALCLLDAQGYLEKEILALTLPFIVGDKQPHQNEGSPTLTSEYPQGANRALVQPLTTCCSRGCYSFLSGTCSP